MDEQRIAGLSQNQKMKITLQENDLGTVDEERHLQEDIGQGHVTVDVEHHLQKINGTLKTMTGNRRRRNRKKSKARCLQIVKTILMIVQNKNNRGDEIGKLQNYSKIIIKTFYKDSTHTAAFKNIKPKVQSIQELLFCCTKVVSDQCIF